jgi:uncharacterized protein DUF4338
MLSLHELILPLRYRRSQLAEVVLNGASRRDLIAVQAAVAARGTGLRLDHRAAMSLLVDLRDSGWWVRKILECGDAILRPPRIRSRQRQRGLLSRWKRKNPQEEPDWLEARSAAMLGELIPGRDLRIELIKPVLHVCKSEQDHELFRFLSATWSAPQGRYVGRRMRFIVRDHGQPRHPVMGILSLGSSIVRSRERDEYIGWPSEVRRRNLINVMDVTVLGALPPYSLLLGGKLMCYVAASDQVRNSYRARYAGRRTEQLKRCADDLALLVTSSLFGRSALYNRVRYQGNDLFEAIGKTGGYGTLHLSPTTISLMKELLQERGGLPANRFGDGPNWKMRLVRTACDLMGLSHEAVLHHGLQKSLYVVRTAHNSLEFLRGASPKPLYHRRPLRTMIDYWKERWLGPRAERAEIKDQVNNFQPLKWRGWT